MFEFLNIPHLSWTAVLDIVIVAAIIYQLLVFIKGTRAVQMALVRSNPARPHGTHRGNALIDCDNEEDHQKGGWQTRQQTTRFGDRRCHSRQHRRPFPPRPCTL